MSQSTNARPCNCDQAIEAETAARKAIEVGHGLSATVEALNLTCATQGRKLAAIEKLLLERGKAAHLREATFTEPYLAHIRNVLLERPW